MEQLATRYKGMENEQLVVLDHKPVINTTLKMDEKKQINKQNINIK